MARNYGMSQRDLQAITLNGAGQSNTAANIVETELLDEMFIYSLRENLLIRSLRIGSSLGLASAFYNGSGAAGQSTGILNTAGIGDVSGLGGHTRDPHRFDVVMERMAVASRFRGPISV
jgi:hypothetical protein